MALRTTAELVAGIIEVDEDISLTPFMNAANELVTELCAGVSSYSTTRLQTIETWLSAHFYAIRDPRLVSEKASKVASTNQSKVDLAFDNSHYGQMAMGLDTNGGLASLNKRMKMGGGVPSLTWLGEEDTSG